MQAEDDRSSKSQSDDSLVRPLMEEVQGTTASFVEGHELAVSIAAQDGYVQTAPPDEEIRRVADPLKRRVELMQSQAVAAHLAFVGASDDA